MRKAQTSSTTNELPPGTWETLWRFYAIVCATFPLTAVLLLGARHIRGVPLWPSSTATVLAASAIVIVLAAFEIRRRAVESGPRDRARGLPWRWVIGLFGLVTLGTMAVFWLAGAMRGT